MARSSAVLRRAAAGVVLAVLALTGCAHSPANAAVVNGAEITGSQLHSAINGVASSLQARPEQIQQTAVLGALIHGRLSDQIAAAHHIVITQGQRDAMIKQLQGADRLAANPDSRPVAYALVDQQLVLSKVGEDVYRKALKDATVTLNPRYGAWNASTGAIDGSSGSLSQPATPVPAKP